MNRIHFEIFGLLCFCFGLSAAHLQYTGVNEAGMDFGYSVGGQGSGPSTCFPTTASFTYMVQNNLNTARVNFRWERVQPTLFGALDPTEFGHLQTTINNAFASGITYVLIDVHNYAQYSTSTIGTAAVPITAFADLWSRLANALPQTNILYGLMNEPVGPVSAGQTGGALSTETWLQAVNAAIAAIRQTGRTNLITVPGLGYTGAHSWAQNYYGTPNSQVMQNVVDPLNNYVYEIHQYFDSSTSFAGQQEDCVDSATIIAQFTDVFNWARANGKKLFLGEFAAGNAPNCGPSTTALLQYMEANSDIYVGWTWWAAGPCWGNYLFSIEPVSAGGQNTFGATQISWLSPFGAGNQGTSPPTTTPVTIAPTTQANQPTQATNPPSTQGTAALTAVNFPSSILATGSFTVQLQYTAPVNSAIVVNILSLPSYSYYGGGSTLVNTGSSQTSVTVTLTGNPAVGTSYTFDYFIVDQVTFNNGQNANAYLSAFVDHKLAVAIVSATNAPQPTVTPTTRPVVTQTIPPTQPPTGTYTQSPTQPAVTTPPTNGNTGITSYVFTIAADTGQNGGQGINNIQCNGGWLTATLNFQASCNVNNIFAYQPMAENGLPTIDMAVYVNGKPGQVQVLNSFNVAASVANGNIWSFTLNDDGPHPGGQLILGTCTAGATNTVTVSFSTQSVLTTQGLPTGADGGPATPAVTNLKPTIVNALPPQFVQGGNAPTLPPPTFPPAQTTITPTATTAATTAASGSTGSIVVSITSGAYQPQCNNGVWMLFFQGYQLSTTLSLNGQTTTNQPMDENGAPMTQIDGYWFIDGVAASIQVTNPSNIANSVSNNNVWSFNLMDDQPQIGTAIAIKPATGIACTFASTIPRISTFFSSKSFVVAPGGNGNVMGVSAYVQVANHLASANQAPSSTTGLSGTTTGAPPTLPPVASTPPASTTKTPTTASGSTGTSSTGGIAGTINQQIVTAIQSSGYCTGAYFTIPIGLTISTNGLQPMAETGLASVTATVTYNNQPVNIISLIAYNMQPTFFQNTFTFMETDDMPAVGGQLTINVPCSYTAPKLPSANGLSISYQAASTVTLNGLNYNVNINNIPSSQLALPMPSGASAYTAQNAASSSSSSNTTGIIVGVVIGVVALVAIIAGAAWYVKNKQKNDSNTANVAASAV